MNPEKIFALVALTFVAGCALIAYGLGGGRLAAFGVGVALVFTATSLFHGGNRR